MVKLNNYSKIEHNGSFYAIFKLPYNLNNKIQTVPVVLNWDTFLKIKPLDKNWHINDKGFVVTNHKYVDENIEKIREITLHDVVIKISDGLIKSDSVLHINKLGVDNRRENLMYDTDDKIITKNIKKKARTICLPKECGILPNDIPSYIWYLKEDSTHGDRFVINVSDIVWKSTGSKKVSLKYKFEETKKYMRYLKNTRPDIFDDYSMNGDLNEEGVKLLNDFYNITEKVGIILNPEVKNKNTNKMLKENLDGLTEEEIYLLELFNPEGERHDFRY